MDNWLPNNLINGMYELYVWVWVILDNFWISGPVLLMAKSEVERKCTDPPRWHPEQKNYYSKLATLCYMGSNWYQIKPIRSHVCPKTSTIVIPKIRSIGHSLQNLLSRQTDKHTHTDKRVKSLSAPRAVKMPQIV